MIIGLVGKAGSGKDTAAGMIPGAKVFSFADPLKEFCAQVFDWPREVLWGPSELRNRYDPRYPGLTPRHALQTLGTEWGRGCYENIWADLGIRRAKAWLEEYNPALHAVFTDCRFINEARAIREAGGEVWRIIRPGSGLSGAASQHSSEIEQDSPAMESLVTATINNVLDVANLRVEVLAAVSLRHRTRT